MKRKLALLIASAMVLSSVPAVSFAATTNRISNIVTGNDDTEIADGTHGTLTAPELRIYEKDLNTVTTAQAFQLDLTNAEWLDGIEGTGTNGEFDVTLDDGVTKLNDVQVFEGFDGDVVVTRLSDSSIIVKGMPKNNAPSDNEIIVNLYTKLTSEGDATVTIDPMDSVISSGSYKFATVADGSTTTTISKVNNVSESGSAIENIVIRETAPGALKDDELEVKLSSDWSFKKDPEAVVYSADGVTVKFKEYKDDNKNEAVFTVSGVGNGTTSAATIAIRAEVKYDDDEVDPGDICEATVSGAGVDRTTLEVAKAVTWGVTWEAEDKTVPTFYWGTADDSDDTLEVHFEETVAASWLGNRKTKIVFPEEVKVLGVDIDNEKHLDRRNSGNYIDFEIDDNEVEIFGNPNGTDDEEVAEADFTFQLSIEPGFTGDITATLTGSGVTTDTDRELSAVVATAAAPVTVTAETTDAKIDYRQTDIGDITITEAEAGLLESGTTLSLEIDKLKFDDDPVVEVVSGDLRIDDVSTDDGILNIDIDSESSKEPAVIKVSGVNLYMERNIPAGSYSLKLKANDTLTTKETRDDDGDLTGYTSVKFTGTDGEDRVYEVVENKDALFKNSVTDGQDYEGLPVFDKRSVTVVDNYVNVVTAGRDQGDNTFTTQIKVTIGATEMYANDQAIALDVPAYISNGYTMLPVRAVTEALSDVAVVRWDDPTHTVTISFGERVVKMTVGSNVMVVNGVEVPMQAQCEITGERAFIPLRDMGYALGLNDSKIVWDDATKTATLN